MKDAVKLQGKIVATLLALTVGSTLIVGLLTAWQIKNFLEDRDEKNLQSQVGVLHSFFTNGLVRADDLRGRDRQLREIAQRLAMRLTIVRKDGVVLFDSDVPLDSVQKLENHSHRPEVVKARSGIIGTDRRMSTSVGVDFLYAAEMITGSALGSLDSGFVRAALPLYEERELERQIWTIVLIVVVVSGLVVALASVGLSKRLSKPVLNIVETARAVTRGEVDRRINYSSNDEIGELAQSINNMAEKLASDIATLKKLERIRSEFLANVSHELRTPIFSIQGFLETLLDGAVDDPHVNREFLEKGYHQAERLNTLLNDLIEISRIESGEMKMSFRYFPLVEFLQPIVEETHAAASKKSISVNLVIEGNGSAKVYGDRDRLKQVMINLIDNAVKYTEPGGKVVCRAIVEKSRCVLSVEDTGSGIAEEHLTRIFERFYRVDRDRSREVGGTGLGLAIVKHIVEAHGSSVQVSSEVGKGSVFSFALKR